MPSINAFARQQPIRRHWRSARRGQQAGLTLVELMVALVLGLLIAGAAIAALIVARQGFTSVDSSTQLRENARFAASVLLRIGVEAGFDADPNRAKEPGVQGFDNALVTLSALPSPPPSGLLPAGLTGIAHNSRNAGCVATDTSCVNGSDVLVATYFGSGSPADSTMINCAGIAEPEPTTNANRAFSIFHVVRSNSGEPTLACTYRDPGSLAWTTVPLVPGVEAFQVLFGVDRVVAGGDAGRVTAADAGVPTRYLRAADLDVGNAYNANNWSRVRSVRIGLIVRGEPGSALQRTAQVYDVLGQFYTNADAPHADDVLARFTAPADGRLRQTLIFTIHLRNSQFEP